MQRRTIRAIGAGVAIAALGLMGLTACSSAPSSNEKVSLTYGIWDKNQEPAMQQIISDFQKQNPNISVNIQLTPNADYWTKLQTAATAGTAPDVFWMNGPNFQLYASNGQLAPNDLVKTSDYPKALVDLYSYQGKVYGAPKDFDTVGVWYNKKLFDAAGVAYPKAGWTWDDLKAAAKALTGKTPRHVTASQLLRTARRTSTTRSPRPAATSSARTARSPATTTPRRSRASSSGSTW